MSSTFSSYQITKSGMYASQRGLFVTGHNISNVNTEGYVRQQAVLMERTPVNLAKMQIGVGVDMQQTRQMRNSFMDTMYRQENQQLGYWESRNKTIQDVQSILGEPAGDGIQKTLDQYFQGWQELSKDPDSLTARALVRQRGNVFVQTVNHISQQLDKMQTDMNTDIRLRVDEANTMAGRIAQLNAQIVENEGNNDTANDFRDERNLLMDKISKMMNVDISEQGNGAVSIAVGGMYLVRGTDVEKLKADYNSENSGFYTVKWARTDDEIQLTSGTLKGLIEARGDVSSYDGSTENGSVIEKGNTAADIQYDAESDDYKFEPKSKNLIPEIRRGLNILVSLMARSVNEIHRQGVGQDMSTGTDFFTKINEDLPLEAGNIQVNPALNDLNLIASSATGEKGDNTIAQKIVEYRDKAMFRDKNLTVNVDEFYRSIITWVGTAGQEATKLTDNQNTLITQIQNNKDSLSGVSMDEEMSNMMKYQHAYNASARMINIVDEMVDTIVNKMVR